MTQRVIECTVHLIAYDREAEWDLFLPNRDILTVIQRLIDDLNLADYIEGPTQSQATLHTHAHEPALEPTLTLETANVVDGDHVWLILTPTLLPTIVHWQTVEANGKVTLDLRAAQSVQAQITEICAVLELEEWIVGPAQAKTELSRSADSGPLDKQKSLLALGIGPFNELWLTIQPHYLPYLVQWNENNEVIQKSIYLALNQPVQQHIQDLLRRLPHNQQKMKGPHQSEAQLWYTQQPLATTQTFAELAIPQHAHLELRMKATVGEVTVIMTNAAAEARQTTLWLPLHVPITHITPTIAEAFQIKHTHLLQLHEQTQTKVWKQQKTLAEYGINETGTIWASVAESVAPTAVLSPRKVISALSMLGILLVCWFLFFAHSETPAIAHVEIAPTITLAPIPSPEIVHLATHTPDLEAQKRIDYALGREAYNQNDWPVAAEAFKRIYTVDPDYLDLDEVGSATFYNWSVNILQTEADIHQAQVILQETFVFSSAHHLGRNRERLLEDYAAALQAATSQEWLTMIELLEPLYDQNAEFLKTPERLYEAYIGYAIDLEEAAEFDRALDIYAVARKLPVADTTVADQRFIALLPEPTAVPTARPQPQPTARPQPQPAAAPQPQRLFFVKQNEDDQATCISMHIVGIDTTGWFFTVDGIESIRGNFNVGHARACGLAERQEATFTVKNAQGQAINGGAGIPTRGSAIMYAEWK